MRAIHFVKPSGSAYLEPLCGVWGLMDTHWTEEEAGVTCVGCLRILRDVASGTRSMVFTPARPLPV